MFDLDKLQLACSASAFDSASKLFTEKWENVSKEFVQYFNDEWLVKNLNWYEGFAKHTLSTNNALEATNRVIKDEQTFRERLDLSHFRVVLFDMIRQWSLEYENNLNAVNFNKPDIHLKWWTAGYQWARSDIRSTSTGRGHYITYTIHSDNTENSIENSKDWTSFSDYKTSLNTAHTTFKNPVTAENWQNGSCDCGNFFKNYVCEHLIGIALRLKYVFAPVEAKNVPIMTFAVKCRRN